MAAAQEIDLSNYATLLVQSTQSRSGTPDGNFYFDKTNGRIELITKQELAQVDLGSGLEDNPLDDVLGIKYEAIYAFENQERRIDEDLRKYDRWTAGTFKFGGAYETINGRKFDDADGTATSSTTDDRFKIRASGWIERAANGDIGRIYFGTRSLGSIQATSQPYYQLSDGGAPVNFSKAGAVDEAIQVYGDATVDANTTTFDTRTYLSNKVRTFGYNYDEKDLDDSGVSSMDGYASGFALGETVHLTSGSYSLADVYGGSQIAPWTSMTLEKLAVPQTETGFNEGNGDFTWVLNNTANGTLYECVAFLDALSQTDDDIDSGAITITRGKRVATWYYYDSQGRIVTKTPFTNEGLFIEGVPTSDEQLVLFTADDNLTRSRPFEVEVKATVGSLAVGDTLAWYHSYFAALYNTAGAVTVQDSSAQEVKGNVSTDAIGNDIIFAFAYDTDTVGGTAGTDKNAVFLCEGDGGVTQAKTLYTIVRQATVSFSCSPLAENNV
jgi:hypothetical protein